MSQITTQGASNTPVEQKPLSHTTVSRRGFLGASAALAAATTVSAQTQQLRVAPFRFDVTPPMGHPLCGGWIKPVVAVDDPLEAIGYVLLGAGKPIVVCVVDWTGILNRAHFQWRAALAEAAGTTPDRVTVHCVHQHNAPFACLDAEQIVLDQGDLPHIVELDFFERCLSAGRLAVQQAMRNQIPVTHIAHGEAKVEKVAGNRRIIGPDGKVISQRGSSSKNPEHHKLPEGLIDPMLKTVALYHGERKVVASHYYACHPMSYYGDGRVSADFCGLARKERQAAEPDCTHLYFNGCGGNIGAGKYNDGSKEMRPVLVSRILAGIVGSEEGLRPQPITSVRWVTEDIRPPANPAFDAERLLKQISDKSQAVVARNRPSYTVAWLQRSLEQLPITLGGLHINDVSMIHLPSECFIEYQLRAQAAAPQRFVACAAYGDGGPWYIPTADAYPQGGYAVGVAWCDKAIDGILTGGIKKLLS
ncbi:MAG: twin-arginine translocation signal domain-containing protein [Planctomycetales bacterium]|nr:twin-arginine translocation signal domain-containing protein [Planctomycetales bacterium]